MPNGILLKTEKGTDNYAVTTVTPMTDNDFKTQEMNNANAASVFSPEFIPYYLQEKKKYDFNHLQTLLYGFLRFFLTNNSQKFYFTNEQLATMFGVKTAIISRSIKGVLKCGEFQFTYKPKANGGVFRLVQKYQSDSYKSISQTSTKVSGNNNSINNNNKKEVNPIFSGKTKKEIVEITRKKMKWIPI